MTTSSGEPPSRFRVDQAERRQRRVPPGRPAGDHGHGHSASEPRVKAAIRRRGRRHRQRQEGDVAEAPGAPVGVAESKVRHRSTPCQSGVRLARGGSRTAAGRSGRTCRRRGTSSDRRSGSARRTACRSSGWPVGRDRRGQRDPGEHAAHGSTRRPPHHATPITPRKINATMNEPTATQARWPKRCRSAGAACSMAG